MTTTRTTRKVSESAAQKPKMKIESLAVKYRPKVLEDLVGQPHLVSQLRGMFKAGKVPSAILLAGESGTGKTTTARMIARYLNCKNPDPTTHAPCGTCISCKYGEGHPDFLEMNMADARGIDDIRGLIASSKNMPVMGENRIFLLDECHQITPQGAQALLKPLEEPPASTLWILATTNPEKLPPTVRGRCHQFEVKAIAPTDLSRRLSRIARLEGIDTKSIEDWAGITKVISDLANGRMRDSIQMLESVIFALNSGEDVDPRSVIKTFLNSTEAELDESAARLLMGIIQANMKVCLKEIRGCGNARGLMNKLRWLIVYLTDNSVGLAKFTPWSGKAFAKLAQGTNIKINLAMLLNLQSLLIEMEFRFNSLSLEESIVMSAMLADFITKRKSESATS